MYQRFQVDFEHPIQQLANFGDPAQMCISAMIADQQHYFVYDLGNHEIIQSIVISDLPGLVVKYFDEEGIILQQFGENSNPNVVDLYYFQWNNESPTTHLPSIEVAEYSRNLVHMKHPSLEGQLMTIDLKTGEVVVNLDTPTAIIDLKFPTTYDQESQYFEWFQKLLKPFDISPVHSCEHMLWQGYHWLSTYIQSDGLQNYLYMLNQQGQLLESFLLADKSKGIALDTFFAIENKLIFVSNYQHLNVLEF